MSVCTAVVVALLTTLLQAVAIPVLLIVTRDLCPESWYSELEARDAERLAARREIWEPVQAAAFHMLPLSFGGMFVLALVSQRVGQLVRDSDLAEAVRVLRGEQWYQDQSRGLATMALVVLLSVAGVALLTIGVASMLRPALGLMAWVIVPLLALAVWAAAFCSPGAGAWVQWWGGGGRTPPVRLRAMLCTHRLRELARVEDAARHVVGAEWGRGGDPGVVVAAHALRALLSTTTPGQHGGAHVSHDAAGISEGAAGWVPAGVLPEPIRQALALPFDGIDREAWLNAVECYGGAPMVMSALRGVYQHITELMAERGVTDASAATVWLAAMPRFWRGQLRHAILRYHAGDAEGTARALQVLPKEMRQALVALAYERQ